MTIYFNIANTVIRVTTTFNTRNMIDPRYMPYRIQPQAHDFDFTITGRWTEHEFRQDMICLAPYGEQHLGKLTFLHDYFWGLHILPECYLIKCQIPGSKSPQEIQAFIFPDKGAVRIELKNPLDFHCIFPYPLDILLWQILGKKANWLIFNGCGIYDQDKGYLFLADSDKSKSKISELFSTQGANIIQDGKIILRSKNRSWWMSPIPLNLNENPNPLPVDRIFIPDHGILNTTVPVSPEKSVNRLINYCLQLHAGNGEITDNIRFLNKISLQLPVELLYFKPDLSVVSYIRYKSRTNRQTTNPLFFTSL